VPADPRTGRTHRRRGRALSNDSINKILAGVRQVLKDAKRRRLIDRNPLELSKLDRSHLDLAVREIRMPRVKSAASERTVPMLPALHEIRTPDSERRPALERRPGLRDSQRYAPASGQCPVAAAGWRADTSQRTPG